MSEREIDLHGLTWTEARAEFVAFYNRSVGTPFTVIHGYGSSGEGGVLRRRLRGFLQRHEAYLEFTPGEELDDNPGCTIISPQLRLPALDERLVESMWEYCKRPKTRGKISGKFRRYGNKAVDQTIELLERQGRLKKTGGGRMAKYEAR